MNIEAVIQEHANMIARIAASYERDSAHQQDLKQDIVMALLIALPKYRGEGSLKAYVARVAQNISISHVRSAVKEKQTGPLGDYDVADDRTCAEETFSNNQKMQQLQQAVRALPLSQRQVIILAFEGLSYKEIGEAMGISAGNVAVRFSRAKEELANVMAKKNTKVTFGSEAERTADTKSRQIKQTYTKAEMASS